MSIDSELPVSAAIQRLYDSMPEREWARLDRHRTEFHITLRALREKLPPPPARVLDCDGGPLRDRAALCLPHCDRDRLLTLLRGTENTHVL